MDNAKEKMDAARKSLLDISEKAGGHFDEHLGSLDKDQPHKSEHDPQFPPDLQWKYLAGSVLCMLAALVFIIWDWVNRYMLESPATEIQKGSWFYPIIFWILPGACYVLTIPVQVGLVNFRPPKRAMIFVAVHLFLIPIVTRLPLGGRTVLVAYVSGLACTPVFHLSLLCVLESDKLRHTSNSKDDHDFKFNNTIGVPVIFGLVNVVLSLCGYWKLWVLLGMLGGLGVPTMLKHHNHAKAKTDYRNDATQHYTFNAAEMVRVVGVKVCVAFACIFFVAFPTENIINGQAAMGPAGYGFFFMDGLCEATVTGCPAQ